MDFKKKNIILSFNKKTKFLQLGISMAVVLGFFIAIQSLIAAWQAPTANPPGDNIPRPIDTSIQAQLKYGGLTVNSANPASNGLIVENGRVGIGSDYPLYPLEVSGMIRTSYQGSLGGIKFPDGSIQTKAYADSSIACNWNAWDFWPWSSCAGCAYCSKMNIDVSTYCSGNKVTSLYWQSNCCLQCGGGGGSIAGGGGSGGNIYGDPTSARTYNAGGGRTGLGDGGFSSGRSGSYGDGSCFVGNIKILIDNNSEKEIKFIQEGDTVLSFDVEKGKNKFNKVLKKYSVPYSGEFVIINSKIKVTPKHPFYINNEWKEIGEAKAGDYMRNADGLDIKIETTERIVSTEQVYNMHVSGDNNYFAEGILVHNKW